METFFSTSGRIRRTTYALRTIALVIPIAMMNVALQGSAGVDMLPFAILVFLAFGTMQVIQAIKRFHDLNMSGWYWLLTFIPLVNIGIGLYLLFADGTEGDTQYGPDPKGRVNKTGLP